MIDISVIIPSYKPSSYIYECLNSLANQTFGNDRFEVILVLNGCKEPYESKLKWYINKYLKDINFKLIQTDQGGVSNARNIGINNICGEFVTFIDDDDYISPFYLEELYACSSNKEVGVSDAISFDDKTRILNEAYPMHQIFLKNQKQSGESILRGKKFFSGPCMKLIHKDIIGNRRFNLRYKNGEDSLFMFLISDKIQKISFTSTKAIYYRRYRENSAVMLKRSFGGKIKNVFCLIIDYTLIFISRPLKYVFLFYLTRIIATIHGLLSKSS